jgi:DNA polymerase III alpha subunit (gram-positive type)
MSVKEKGLLFTLKVIMEMEMKDLGFARGIDFNESEISNFKIENNTIYFPFTAVTGVGTKVAEKIVSYRQEKGRIND